jgi:hypothetical protein
MAITDVLYKHTDGIHSVSQDPLDNYYCVWRGDVFISAWQTLPRAIQACDERATAFDVDTWSYRTPERPNKA